MNHSTHHDGARVRLLLRSVSPRVTTFASLALAAAMLVPMRTLGAQVAGAAPSAGMMPGVGRASGAVIDSASRSLVTKPEPNARQLPVAGAAANSYQLVVLARSATGEAEIHDEWDDIVLVKSGTALMRTGRALVGGQQREPGEHRGADISGARDQAVGPGDLLVVPAGMPHQWKPTGSEPFAYVVLKVRPGKARGTP